MKDIKNTQIQKQTQYLSQNVINSLHLLNMPYLSLKSFISNMASDNPFLIEDDDESVLINHFNSEYNIENFLSDDEEITLQKDLRQQISFMRADETIKNILYELTDYLDANGYFMLDKKALLHELPYPDGQTEKAIALLQTLFPVGIGAFDLKECLLLQTDQSSYSLREIETILSAPPNYLSQKSHYPLAAFCGFSLKKTEKLLEYIKTLNPYPGSIYHSKEKKDYIFPEISILPSDDDLEVHVCSSAIKLNKSYYENLLSDSSDKELLAYIKEKYRDGNKLLSALHLRYQTITKVCSLLAEYQFDYLSKGEGILKAININEIAQILGLSASTVSRCINEKYVTTIHGVIPLKKLLSQGFNDMDNNRLSITEIKEMIKEIIQRENPAEPVNDESISLIMQEQGIDISRRTVNKYRESMHIPNSKKRRRSL